MLQEKNSSQRSSLRGMVRALLYICRALKRDSLEVLSLESGRSVTHTPDARNDSRTCGQRNAREPLKYKDRCRAGPYKGNPGLIRCAAGRNGAEQRP